MSLVSQLCCYCFYLVQLCFHPLTIFSTLVLCLESDKKKKTRCFSHAKGTVMTHKYKKISIIDKYTYWNPIHFKYPQAVIVDISKAFEWIHSRKVSLLHLVRLVCVEANSFCGRKESALLFLYWNISSE